MSLLLIAIVASIAAGVLALALGHRQPRAIGAIGVVGAGIAFLSAWGVVGAGLVGDLGTQLLSLAHIPTGSVGFDLAFRADGLSAFTSLLVASVALAVQIYSVDYLRGDARYPSYVAMVSLFTAAMLVVVAADDLLVLLVGWELMGICSYFLIGHHWERADARDGAVKAFIVTRLGDIGFLFGIFVLGLSAGTFRISELQRLAANGELSTGMVTLATLLLLCGVVGKSAQFPLHVWLPDAMAGPTPVSALIHAATMVAAGVFFVARMLNVFALAPVTMAVLAVIASITMLGAALAALAQDDVKRVLAWSTVSQLAYMLAGLAVGGYTASFLHLVSHGAFKALLFLCAGSVIHAVGGNAMSAMGGLRRAMPVTFWTMTVGLAALVGLPPLSGFFSKDAILGVAQESALHGNLVAWLVLVAGFATVVVTAMYATRLWLRVFFGPTAAGERAEAPVLMRWPLVVLAVPAALLGLLAFMPATLTSWLGNGPAPTLEAGELVHPLTAVISVALAVLAAGFVIGEWHRIDKRDPSRTLGRFEPILANAFGVDAFYERWVVRPVYGLARTVVAGDRDVVDFYVLGSGRAARAIAGLLRMIQTGNAQTYLTLLLAGVVLLAIAAGVVVS
ncbi:NADH-quinone oxidoreductase subunit 5 family protein [Tenggerimyces flavus]|uniref:NADH-quinone oxidoreductase subunit L n=1 Tax=Tenggerimyces flavus TaxID=1708749 RepID=A0ABV7Y884_9ACTN|nr:NADH-quinone oxidoreductase subunit L [Tenggerimyces flavus]MBM7791153.1 NADH-quinone oxidoreductase subunit L [Tenggerimyces flavus]